VQADFNAMGPQRGKVIRVGLRDQGSVRKDGNQESTADGMFIELEKVWAGEWLASGEAEFQGSGLGQLIHDAEDISSGELLTDRIGTIETIRVTHYTA